MSVGSELDVCYCIDYNDHHILNTLETVMVSGINVMCSGNIESGSRLRPTAAVLADAEWFSWYFVMFTLCLLFRKLVENTVQEIRRLFNSQLLI